MIVSLNHSKQSFERIIPQIANLTFKDWQKILTSDDNLDTLIDTVKSRQQKRELACLRSRFTIDCKDGHFADFEDFIGEAVLSQKISMFVAINACECINSIKLGNQMLKDAEDESEWFAIVRELFNLKKKLKGYIQRIVH